MSATAVMVVAMAAARLKAKKDSAQDRPVSKLPALAIGLNSNQSVLVQSCPRRDYVRCYGKVMAETYPSPDLMHIGRPRDEVPNVGASYYATLRLPSCERHDKRTSSADVVAQLPKEDGGADESFVSSALVSLSSSQRVHPPVANASALRRRLHLASVRALSGPPPPPPSEPGQRGAGALSCASPARALDERLLMLIGLPTTAAEPRRREAARTSWMRHESYGRSVAACFLLSAHAPAHELDALLAEHSQHGDLLLLDAPETRWLITKRTRYSNYTRLGRGMPTFKQYSFFQHAANTLPNVPYIGKIDDDTAPNLGAFLPLLSSIRCKEHALIGAINWAGVIPNAFDTGVRNDRCAFGWSLYAALKNFGTSFGTPPANGKARGAGYFPACDGLGSTVPFPYGTGAGYIFTSKVLKWVATDPAVIGWVRDAAGPTREDLQWQKFEDTSTGYWLSYAPFRIDYVNIGRWVHDFVCHPNGAHKAKGGGLYRPPTNTTLLVHNLKGGGFHYTSFGMARGADEYNHERCTADLGSVKKAQHRDWIEKRKRDALLNRAKRNGGRGRLHRWRMPRMLEGVELPPPRRRPCSSEHELLVVE